MTINDIENALKTLENNHPHLDEPTLITLLTAGGWDEKNIRDAVIIFRNTSIDKQARPEQELFVPTEGEHILPEIADASHSLSENNSVSSKDEFPSELPLRLFEDSTHVWPFSLYKKVFHNNETSSLKGIKEEKETREEHKHFGHNPLTKKDEELIFVIGTMLIIILLLLSYMYYNGRL